MKHPFFVKLKVWEKQVHEKRSKQSTNIEMRSDAKYMEMHLQNVVKDQK